MLPFLFDAFHAQRDGEGGGGGGLPPATPPPPAPPVAPPPPAPAPPAGDPASLDAALKLLATRNAELADARAEAAQYRTGNKGKMAEAARALAGLAGIELPNDQAPDVQTLVKQLQERDQHREKELKQLRVDNALGDIYAKHGAKPKLTRALLESDGVLSSLDPSDGEFSKTLNGAVKKLLEDNPELKVSAEPGRPAPKSGPDLPPGGNGTPPQLTKADLERMSSKEISEAFAKGQLNGVLGRK